MKIGYFLESLCFSELKDNVCQSLSLHLLDEAGRLNILQAKYLLIELLAQSLGLTRAVAVVPLNFLLEEPHCGLSVSGDEVSSGPRALALYLADPSRRL